MTGVTEVLDITDRSVICGRQTRWERWEMSVGKSDALMLIIKVHTGVLAMWCTVIQYMYTLF